MTKKTTMNKKDNTETSMSFFEHLEALRWHILRSTAVVLIFAILAFLFPEIIFDKIIFIIKSPDFITNKLLCEFGRSINISVLCINTTPLSLQNIYIAGQFTMHITVSVFTGLILAFPYIIFELWRFIKPAFYKTEKKHIRAAMFYCSALFLMGILFGYYVIAPLSVNFLGTYSVSQQIINQINFNSYISTVVMVTFANGVIFELPMLIYFFTKIGLFTPQFLRKYRKHAIVINLIIAAIITPPDIFSQILVALPLLLLYEVGIIISKRVIRKNNVMG